tara:strand:- start:107 stop:598 length:492 start_codon:yes stop_codon:yes gene_type:complete
MTNRITKETAELIAFPPTTWYTKSVDWLLDQETFAQNYTNIPVQEELVKDLTIEGIHAPMLVLPSWYPVCGSQRLRACMEIRERFMGMHPVLQQQVRVCRFDKEYWNCYQLWPDEEFRSKAIQVYFQMLEVVFKSIHFIEDDPMKMIKFETDGDNLKWKARDG